MTSCCWLDVKLIWRRLIVNNFNDLLSFHLLTFLKSWEISLENYIAKGFLNSFFWSIGYFVHQLYCDFGNICLAFSGVEYTKNFCILAWTICIFLEKALNSRYTLITTTAWSNMSLHSLLFILKCLSFSDNDFLFRFDNSQPWVEPSDKNLHFIFYSSFSFLIFWFILKLSIKKYHVGSWIHVTSFKTKRERILAHRNEIASKIMKNCWEFSDDTSSRMSFNFFQLSSFHDIIVSHWIFLMFMVLWIRAVHSDMEFL